VFSIVHGRRAIEPKSATPDSTAYLGEAHA